MRNAMHQKANRMRALAVSCCIQDPVTCLRLTDKLQHISSLDHNIAIILEIVGCRRESEG